MTIEVYIAHFKQKNVIYPNVENPFFDFKNSFVGAKSGVKEVFQLEIFTESKKKDIITIIYRIMAGVAKW